MIKKLFNLFANKSETSSTKTTPHGDKKIEDIVAFVDYVVRALVDDPGLVKIEAKTGNTENEKIINIVCKKEDVGKIIGKSGKTIMAIRSLVSGAASRLNERISVEVADNVAD